MTDRPDFETMLERRMRAYAATGVRTTPVHEVVRSTLWAAETPVGRTSRRGGPRRPALLLGLAALLLLGTVAGAAMVGRLPRTIQGVFVAGPSLDGGRAVSALALPDGRIVAGVTVDEVDHGSGALHCPPRCRAHLAILDPGSDAFQLTAYPPAGLAVESMALLHDGRVLLLDQSIDGQPGATIYDLAADRWESVGQPSQRRRLALLVTLEDGRVLVAGGEDDGPLATAELFDPATGMFSPTGSMTRPRMVDATATLLSDGRVLFVGGGPDRGASAELYDPATGVFAPTGDTTSARGGFHSATRLADGRVLLAGGLAPIATDSAEVYDPASGTFTVVGPMTGRRFMHAAALLSDGTVLVAGGADASAPEGPPTVTADAEIFDPATGTFRATANLRHPRLSAVAVAADGRVLILGHLDPSGSDTVVGASTEWFE